MYENLDKIDKIVNNIGENQELFDQRISTQDNKFGQTFDVCSTQSQSCENKVHL